LSGIELNGMTLTRAVALLRDREITAVELLAAVHQRYLDTEHALRSWAERYEQEALAQAVVADRRLTAGSNAPLLGIPVGVKDIFDIAGKVTRCNSALRASAPPAVRDAVPVHRMRKAGAVLLGKTVTQEYAAGVISAPARNPWDPERVPGGSSGGSAASVMSGTSLGALGSDTGGSIRIPASLTAAVGFKPTFGRIDLTGTFPLSPSLDTVGPMTRTVADAVAMYLVIADRNRDVYELIGQFDALAAHPTLAGVRIGVMRGFFTERLHPSVRGAFERAVVQLVELGAELIDVDWALARTARASALLISRVESAAVHHGTLRGTPDLMSDDVRYRFEVGALLSGDVYLRARAARIRARDTIGEVFRQHALEAVIAPTTPAVAPRVDSLELRFDDEVVEAIDAALTRFTMPWNATGQPVVTVPSGFDDDRMPVGLSFVGRPDDEVRLLEIAQHFEQATPWHRQRPALAPTGARTCAP
jgi:aspartyl-tRNA(Asn)/glutamyl-tRNA(Gln) amidotransferase subunit A